MLGGTTTRVILKGDGDRGLTAACVTTTKPGSIIADGIATGDFAHAEFVRSTGGKDMSKGLNQKKDAKKKPAKSLKEKRAEKQAKKKS